VGRPGHFLVNPRSFSQIKGTTARPQRSQGIIDTADSFPLRRRRFEIYACTAVCANATSTNLTAN
jgi:hypothetical protein